MEDLCLQVVKDGLTAEKASANCAELKRVQAGDVSYEEAKAAAASRARLELDGVSAEKSQVHAKVSKPFMIECVYLFLSKKIPIFHSLSCE